MNGQSPKSLLKRRTMLLALPGASFGVGAAGCRSGDVRVSGEPKSEPTHAQTTETKASDVGESTTSEGTELVLDVFPLSGSPWKTFDPFLFCVHHHDTYPEGNDRLGPATPLSGRDIGQDFSAKDGWSMYHGNVVPGFPRHPHRGFETITVTRRGFIDHSDSLGATARYGKGDVQWMTAGAGIVHAEMFPLLDRKAPNPAELFQIWINLPKASKFVAPRFSMMWSSSIPKRTFKDQMGRSTSLTVVAGTLGDATAPSPPPDSWAANPNADVAIWSLKLDPGATWQLPPASQETHRTLYYFSGKGLKLETHEILPQVGVRVRADRKAILVNGSRESELLILQGRPLREPIVKRGPFVMNTQEEISQAYLDYRRTGFGGWPWASNDPVHARREGRFAVHADGHEERAI